MNTVPSTDSGAATDALAPLRPDWLPEADWPWAVMPVPVDEARLAVTDVGTGPTLLFVHGSPMSSYQWRAMIRELEADFRCVAVDLPGLGLSDAPRAPGGSYARNARLLEGLIHTLDLRDFTLVAHATGGPSALEAALKVPDRLRALNVSSSFAWPLQRHPRLARFVRLVGSRPFRWVNVYGNGLPRLSARFGRRVGRFAPTEQRAIVGPFRRWERRWQLQDLLEDLTREESRFEALERGLTRLADRPGLIAYGAHDNGFAGGLFEHWQALYPAYRVAVHPHAGHFLSEDDPMFWVRQLRRWWFEDVAPGTGR